MGMLGYQVVNVGERDIRTGYPEFERRSKGLPFRFVSANIVDRETKAPVFPPHVIVEARSPDGKTKARVGVIGVVRYNPIFLKAGPGESNIVIDHPSERVQAEVQKLREEQVDAIVLLAALHKEDAKKIVQAVPQIDFVLGSYGGEYTAAAEVEGTARVLYCGNRGQRIGESRVFFEDRDGGKQVVDVTTMLHTLSRTYPNDGKMLEFVTSKTGSPAEEEQPVTDPSGGPR
jgi:2',3'-cyclic-nucleotide 2'-phosphodiesterase (5'-nucleotidase family)